MLIQRTLLTQEQIEPCFHILRRFWGTLRARLDAVRTFLSVKNKWKRSKKILEQLFKLWSLSFNSKYADGQLAKPCNSDNTAGGGSYRTGCEVL